MDYSLKERSAEIINEHILTPVIYMLESDFQIEFVCFCDTNIEAEQFARTEEKLNNLFDVDAVIMDIREYDEMDRMEIIQNGELIYTAHPVFEQLFASSMAEDVRIKAIEKSELIKRYNASGSVYLQ